MNRSISTEAQTAYDDHLQSRALREDGYAEYYCTERNCLHGWIHDTNGEQISPDRCPRCGSERISEVPR